MRPTASRRSCRPVALVAALAASAVLALTGCNALAQLRPDAGAHAAARTAVADVSRGLYRHGTDVIDDYARWADAATADSGGVELVGVEPYPGAVHGEPFGALQFRATVQPTEYDEPYVACFESEFDFWGVATEEFGDWDVDAAVARDIPCPPDAHRIAPPVDTRTEFVVPDGAEALAVEVLTNAPAAASADRIVAEVTERMPQPTGEREQAFEPRAAVVDGDIGFAMGDADDCLLVKRDAGGVQVLSVPRVLLLPGELGCSPETALRPEEQLRSPH
ncbi:hypothetical protein J2X63_000716 [Agromyces sp. 3263]|uniref:hypothetical protein n=1 Tax=Agromyces sp. 3263 TaxID=2817750 RepID=UPI0028673DD1|nr:hypothetical protein [Agromyces sp. 3263]MDR6905030.1 hypothetical protein [Agromyces sp. 3263]